MHAEEQEEGHKMQKKPFFFFFLSILILSISLPHTTFPSQATHPLRTGTQEAEDETESRKGRKGKTANFALLLRQRAWEPINTGVSFP